MIPVDIGGYPVNYRFVPQTMSYDGDPFEALFLGPLTDGRPSRGDCWRDVHGRRKGIRLENLLSHPLRKAARHTNSRTLCDARSAATSNKQHEPGGFSKVPGWGRKPKVSRTYR